MNNHRNRFAIILKELELGPLRPFHYLGLDFSTTWKKLMKIAKICKELVLHFVLAHVGIEGNELADAWAKRAVETYTDETQAEVNISLAAFKAYMRQKITKKYNEREEQ